MSSDPTDFHFEEDKLVKVNDGKKHIHIHKKSEKKIKALRGVPDDIEEKKSGNINNDNVITNWTEANINTLRAWKASLREAIFIYNYVMEKLKKMLNRIKVVLLIFSTLTTLISAIATYALTDTTNYNNVIISLVITILTTLIGAIMSFLNGFIKIYNLDELVQSYTLYIERMDTIYSDISSELILPVALREDAFEFIKREHEIYLNLIKNSPEIDSSENSKALKAYHSYLEDETANLTFASKYTNNDAIIEVM